MIIQALIEQLSSASPEVRNLYSGMIAALRRQHFASLAETPTAEAERVVQQLRAEGIVSLGQFLDTSKVADMVNHFRPHPLYAGHTDAMSDGVPRDFEQTRRAAHYGAYAREAIARCPHLIELANDPHLLQIAESYFGCPPTIYHLNAWWSFAQETRAHLSQQLHRDIEELRILTLFIYLTPVDDMNGPNRYIRYSHDRAALIHALVEHGMEQPSVERLIAPLFEGAGYHHSVASEALLGRFGFAWKGPAGSAVIADTYGLHMGIPPQQGERLMLWVRYGIGHSTSTFGGGHGDIVRPRIPQTDRARYINRILLADR